jgi:hypothetical protein
MNSLFLSWSKRNLSILGKVLIIKALIIPIFTFIVSSCVIPEKYVHIKNKPIFPNTFTGKYFSGISFQFENFESTNLLTHDAFKYIKFFEFISDFPSLCPEVN